MGRAVIKSVFDTLLDSFQVHPCSCSLGSRTSAGPLKPRPKETVISPQEIYVSSKQPIEVQTAVVGLSKRKIVTQKAHPSRTREYYINNPLIPAKHLEVPLEKEGLVVRQCSNHISFDGGPLPTDPPYGQQGGPVAHILQTTSKPKELPLSNSRPKHVYSSIPASLHSSTDSLVHEDMHGIQVEGTRTSEQYVTEEIPMIIPPGFVRAIRPLPAPTEPPTSFLPTLVEPLPREPLEPLIAQNIYVPPPVQSVDHSEDSKDDPREHLDAGVAESRTLEVTDDSKLVDPFAHHTSAVATLSTKLRTTDTGRFEPRMEDDRSQILVDNPSELNVVGTERTRLPLSFEILNWGLRGRNNETGLIRDGAFGRNATPDHSYSTNLTFQSFKSASNTSLAFSLVLPTRLFECAYQLLQWRTTHNDPSPTCLHRTPFDFSLLLLTLVTKTSTLSFSLKRNAEIGWAWTPSRSPCIRHGETFPFDGVILSWTHYHVMALAQANNLSFILSFSPRSPCPAFSSPLSSGLERRTLARRKRKRDDLPSGSHPTNRFESYLLIFESSGFASAFVTQLLFWFSTNVPGPPFDSYQVKVSRHLSVVDPVGPDVPKTRYGIFLSTVGVAVLCYLLVYSLELIKSGHNPDPFIIHRSCKRRFDSPHKKVHVWSCQSDVSYEYSDWLGTTMRSLRESDFPGSTLTCCWTDPHQDKSYSFEQEDWRERYGLKGFSAAGICCCTILLRVMLIQSFVWAMKYLGSTIENAVYALWVLGNVMRQHNWFPPFNDLLFILIEFNGNYRGLQYGYEFWPKFPDNPRSLPTILSAELSSFELIVGNEYNACALQIYSRSVLVSSSREWTLQIHERLRWSFKFWSTFSNGLPVFVAGYWILDVVDTDSRRALPFPALFELGVDLKSFCHCRGADDVTRGIWRSTDFGTWPFGEIITGRHFVLLIHIVTMLLYISKLTDKLITALYSCLSFSLCFTYKFYFCYLQKPSLYFVE